jgi:SNF family Na+-dependent transporter
MSSGKKDGWGSSLGIILAVTGSAVVPTALLGL